MKDILAALKRWIVISIFGISCYFSFSTYFYEHKQVGKIISKSSKFNEIVIVDDAGHLKINTIGTVSEFNNLKINTIYLDDIPNGYHITSCIIFFFFAVFLIGYIIYIITDKNVIEELRILFLVNYIRLLLFKWNTYGFIEYNNLYIISYGKILEVYDIGNDKVIRDYGKQIHIPDVINNAAYGYIYDMDIWYLSEKLRKSKTFIGTDNQIRNKKIDELLKDK